MDERIIERLRDLDVEDNAIVLISYMYDNGDVTEEDIFDIGEDDEFNIENVDNYDLNEEPTTDDYASNGVNYNGEGYLIYDNEDEARDAAIEDVKYLLDDIGIEGINFGYIGGLEEYVDTDWFEDAERESFEFYCEDIANEGNNTYDNRLVQECYDAGLIDDDAFELDEDGEIDYTQCTVDTDELTELYVDYHMSQITDFVEEYIFQFGKDEFNDVVKERNLADYDAIAEACVDYDGIGHTLARYDGEDRDYDFEGTIYYLYRYD